jgi:hypothetical protein
MAIDGPRLFQNDIAHDFVDRVASLGVAEVIRAYREILDHPKAYLDLDTAVEAWVAAELVVARAGEGRQRTGNEPETYDAAIASLPADEGLLKDTQSVLDRLENGEANELVGLLDDAGESSACRELLQDFRLRLRRAHLPRPPAAW